MGKKNQVLSIPIGSIFCVFFPQITSYSYNMTMNESCNRS